MGTRCNHPSDQLRPFARLAAEADWPPRFECVACGAIVERRERQDGAGYTYLLIQAGDDEELLS